MKRPFLFMPFVGFALFLSPLLASAASLSLSPTAGTFTVGSTFDIQVFLNTQGTSINAVELSLSFPPDKLQLVSPGAGKSIISVWTSQPQFNNQSGNIRFQGGIPGGINMERRLLTTLTFRVKSVGQASVRFMDSTKVLLNDGFGTDALRSTQNGLYDLILPPPAGPLVASKTHPVESDWYSQKLVSFNWAGESPDITGFSYVLDNNPIGIPDNISEGVENEVVYQNVENGTSYFHIKSLRGGRWGGVTHFSVNVDSQPPANFKIEIIPKSRTVRKQPIVQFLTTDEYSGLSHYELKLVALSPPEVANAQALINQQLFVEAQSPYLPPPLEVGDYDVIVRAYDNAGNYREVTQRIKVREGLLEFFGSEGFKIRGDFLVSWFWIWGIIAVAVTVLGWFAFRLQCWHREHDERIVAGHLPDHVKQQLEELKRLKRLYGKNLVILLLLVSSFAPFLSASVGAEGVPISPPLFTSVSRDISSEEIFYAGGKTDNSEQVVVLYFQNLSTGETQTHSVTSDRKGDWFYRHDGFLTSGKYLLWAQTSVGDELSPPSPQLQMTVRETAIKFGSSRLSFESLYLIFTLVLLFAFLVLVVYVTLYTYRARVKHKMLLSKAKEAEESVRRGFAVLRRDLEEELRLVRNVKMNAELSREEREKEERLMKDLALVEKYVGREIWEIEHAGEGK